MTGRLQYAAQGHDAYVAAALDHAPRWATAAVNKARQARGLAPVLPRRDYAEVEAAAAAARAAAEAKAIARYAAPKSTLPRAAQRHEGRGPLVAARVLIVPCGGDAKASCIRGRLDEAISPIAFGTAAELNTRGAFDLRQGHEGPRLAVAGKRLRFVDGGSIGPILCWEPDLTCSWNVAALRAIEAGHDQASVCMTNMVRRVVDLPFRHELVVRATLEHVALLLDGGQRGAYPGARARVWRSVWANDRAELQAQIDAVIERSRWYSRRARGGTGW